MIKRSLLFITLCFFVKRTGTPDAEEHQESFKTIKEGVDSARHVVAVPFQRSQRVLPRKPERNHLSDAPRLVPVFLCNKPCQRHMVPHEGTTGLARSIASQSGASHCSQGH